MLFTLKVNKKLQKLAAYKNNGTHVFNIFSVGIYSEIEINSTTNKIYEVLTDFENYDLWNPCITNIKGTAKAGTLLQVKIQWPGLKKNNYKLELIELTPNEIIYWKGQFATDFLFNGKHCFLIQQTKNQKKVIIKQIELFSGVLVPFLFFFLKRNIFQGFLQVNLALKNHIK